VAFSFSLSERVVVGFRVLEFYFNGFEDFNIPIYNVDTFKKTWHVRIAKLKNYNLH